jgi:hypothetical protein
MLEEKAMIPRRKTLLHVERLFLRDMRPDMANRSIEELGKITTEPSPQETGPQAERTKAAEKAVAMGQVTNPEEAAKASAADRDRGGRAKG